MPQPVPNLTPTWLCSFIVQVDLPNNFAVTDLENTVAFGVAQYLTSLGITGGCSAQLLATQGNVTVATVHGKDHPAVPATPHGAGTGDGNNPTIPNTPNATNATGGAS